MRFSQVRRSVCHFLICRDAGFRLKANFSVQFPGAAAYHLGCAALPICMHRSWRWRVLDTFDLYSPKYQSYHTHYEVFRWFEEAGLEEIRVREPGISLIGRRPLGV